MKIDFSNRKLQKTCSIEKEGIKQLGVNCARKLRARMADLKAAVCLEDLRNLPGRLHELGNNRNGQFAMDLKHPHRLIMIPSEDPVPRKEDGGIDWSLVTAVTIIEIVDYHN